MTPSTWEDIRARLDVENTFTATMGDLRDIHGAGKLGQHVASAISKKLAQMGVGHIPAGLPLAQNDQVRLFLHGTPIGTLISMVLTPGEANDSRLLEYVEENGTSHAEIINQIRDLIG